jgi:membrane-associated phospholipid phosphatase
MSDQSWPEFRFQPARLGLLLVIAAVMLASWLIPVTRSIWDAADLACFQLINSTLQPGVDGLGSWSAFWALMNVRLADLFPLVLMVCLFAINRAVFPADRFLDGLTTFVVLLFFMLLVRVGFDALVKVFDVNHPSPTLVFDDAVRLSLLYPEWPTKDEAGHSFPGDHASVMMVWAGYCLYQVRNRWSVAVLGLTVFFSLPRLMSGAHWLSDVAVGGTSLALIVLAFALYTPLLNLPSQKCIALRRWCFRTFGITRLTGLE